MSFQLPCTCNLKKILFSQDTCQCMTVKLTLNRNLIVEQSNSHQRPEEADSSTDILYVFFEATHRKKSLFSFFTRSVLFQNQTPQVGSV